jgi:carbohydrate kinase (thermoresistant glucokinase family)
VAPRLGNVTASSAGLVVSCSALKRSYRNLLRSGAADLRFVHLHGDPGLLSQRMAARQGHYMPASLLQSQLDTLEPPGDDEQPIRLDIAWPLERQLAEALRQLAPAPALPVPSAPSPNPTPP